MAFVVVSGDKINSPEGTSYASEEQFTEYATLNSDRYGSTPDDSAKRQAALVRATAYVDGLSTDKASESARFYNGQRATTTQNLKFPRANCTRTDGTLVANDSIPFSIIQATCEAALYEINNPGALQEIIKLSRVQQQAEAGVKVKYKAIRDIDDARNCVTLVMDYVSDLLRKPSWYSNLWVMGFDGHNDDD